jgi:alkylation response protein AidB-like acyl-CoA dehydrogenase
MANLLVDERDAFFVLFEQLKIQDLCQADIYSECSLDIFEMSLKEAQKLAANEIWPTNVIGDREGCVRDGDDVKVPEPFHRIWKIYSEGGWLCVTESPDAGGLGMPHLIDIACNEYFVAANPAFSTFSGLTRGAARLIETFGTVEQREKYMYRMYAGEWAGTMCLTEPQAGSDVGALRTTAKRNPDGTYSISGKKIFITDGNHDLTENIVHPVLARIEGAPPGTKGISLFVVPKYRVNDDGTLGDFNDIHVGAVENKMGIHGSPTCVLNFGEDGRCVGELLGEENQGMRIMFQMMNEARIGVGLQGLATASAAYLHALKYASERLQGPDLEHFRDPEAPRVPIIRHPDVRRMLMFAKSLVEGIRSLIYYTAYCLDRVRTAADDEDRRKWQGIADLLTPVVKAYSTDMGFRVAETAMQVYGGYGYIREYPLEQFLRDIKIASIYEGTNGIQALDLVARKLGMAKGMVFMSLLGEVNEFIASTKGNEDLREAVDKLEAAKNAVAAAALHFAAKAKDDFTIPVLYATPFLELMGDMLVGWQLLWQARIAHEKLRDFFIEKGAPGIDARQELIRQHSNAAYYSGKIAAATFFAHTFLTLSPAKAEVIKNGDLSALLIEEAAFASV